ncbi:MAG: M23 family metallopeptidase [Leptospiraceae bacterium]|nr:M23 family metallopeptidase [Leptospiraceae bacterium]MCP5499977.1 M23 family metallopeptidase [Leptospiraceae bacterium]
MITKKFKPYTNTFSYPTDSIHFAYLSAADFSYTVSSCLDSWKCVQNLFDSNSKTYWVSEKKPEREWLIVDFGSKRLMNKAYVEFPAGKEDLISGLGVQVQLQEKWKTIVYTEKLKKQITLELGNIDATLLRFVFKKKQDSSIVISNIKVLLNSSNLTGINKNLTGYVFPVPNGLVPEGDYSLPGAPRAYRNGIHKGVDIIEKTIEEGQKAPLTEEDVVVATNDGIIVRADLNYLPITMEEYTGITSYNQTHRVTFVDRDFGGRQIWLDHGNGVMSSYNHLSFIAKHIQVGTKVKKGEILGRVGNSGLRSEAEGTKSQIHLHFELWVNGEFVGKGMQGRDSRKFLQLFFTEY